MQQDAVRPKYAPMPVWCALSGLGRSKSYQLIADGTLRGIKVGTRLLIDIEAGIAALALMPAAQIRPSANKEH
jgi:hypothetical protein